MIASAVIPFFFFLLLSRNDIILVVPPGADNILNISLFEIFPPPHPIIGTFRPYFRAIF